MVLFVFFKVIRRNKESSGEDEDKDVSGDDEDVDGSGDDEEGSVRAIPKVNVFCLCI